MVIMSTASSIYNCRLLHCVRREGREGLQIFVSRHKNCGQNICLLKNTASVSFRVRSTSSFVFSIVKSNWKQYSRLIPHSLKMGRMKGNRYTGVCKNTQQTTGRTRHQNCQRGRHLKNAVAIIREHKASKTNSVRNAKKNPQKMMSQNFVLSVFSPRVCFKLPKCVKH